MIEFNYVKSFFDCLQLSFTVFLFLMQEAFCHDH